LFFITGKSQQNLSITLPQADSIFLKNNLLLLAQEYNIDAQEALILQARSYPNPLFSADLNAYDPENKKSFHTGSSGEKAFTVEQLILLGGKRKTEIEMARQNKKLAELELEDLLRNLQYQLHTGFFKLNQQKNTLDKFKIQLQLLDTLIASYDAQAKRGNIPQKDVIRLKSVYFKINNEKSALSSEYLDQQQNMQLLLQVTNSIEPKIEENEFEKLTTLQLYGDLLEKALQYRPDLKIASESEGLSLLNLQYQKKLAIPDIALNGSYDQRGGAFVNQLNMGISIPLPLWNRNRGNIKAAEYNTKTYDIYRQQKRKEVETDVLAAWQNLNISISEFNKIKNYYSDDFEIVFNGVNQNFQKRNITILEFVDFFESYNESQSELERVKNHLANSAMQVNYVTAAKIY
jgi:cobalt-zinc-cadmium efflux system outer membrane protein